MYSLFSSATLHAGRTALRALALRQMNQEQSTPAVGASPRLSPMRFGRSESGISREGWSGRCSNASRRDKVQARDQQSQQRIIAVVFSPPEGRVRWMMRLLTEEVIRRKLVSQVGRETIRLLLECHDLKIREQVYRTVVQRSDGIGGLEQRRL